MFIHAYQSYLWNEVVKSFLKETYKKNFEFDNLIFVKEVEENISVPLVAFDTVFKDPVIKRLYEHLLKEEKISLRDFIVRSLPESMPVSTEREVFVKVSDFKKEQNSLEFTLPKGSYATIFLKQLESFL